MSENERAINIIRSAGYLKVSPLDPDLMEELTFTYRFRDKIKKRIFDRRTGGMRDLMIDGPMRFLKKNLFSIAKDGESLITYDGLLHKIKSHCDMRGVPYEISVEQHPYVEPDVTPRVFEGLYPDQKCALELMLDHDGGCLVEAATNTGKTRIIASLCRAYHGRHGLVVTNRQSVANKLYKDLLELAPECSPGVYLTGNKKPGKTVVITSASLGKFRPEDVDFIIYDEVHGAASEVRSKDLLRFRGAVKYGLSATIKSNFKGVDKYLEAIFGPIVFELTDQELEAMSRATPLHVYCMDVSDGPHFSDKAQTMTMERNGIWFNRHRNRVIKECVDRAPADQQLIIYVRTLTHVEELMVNWLGPEFEVFHGKLKGAEKRRIMEGFNSGSMKRIISTDCLAEGVDPKNLHIIINANWMQSDVSVLQKAGRNRRLTAGKAFGIVIDFNDCWSPKTARRSKNRMKHYAEKGYQITENSRPSQIEFINNGNDQNRKRCCSPFQAEQVPV